MCGFNGGMKSLCLSLILILSIVTHSARAENSKPDGLKPAFASSGLKLPRFVSLRSGKVFARTGPGKKYPVRYVYKRKNMPVEIVLEYDNWRKIRDTKGDEGWVHKTLLTGRRTALVSVKGAERAYILKRPQAGARAMAVLENQVLVRVDKCVETGWCFVDGSGYKGWISAKNLWGVYENEFFD